MIFLAIHTIPENIYTVYAKAQLTDPVHVYDSPINECLCFSLSTYYKIVSI